MKRWLYAVLSTLSFVVVLHLHTAFPHATSDSPASFTIIDLGTLGGTESFAYGVNDFGDVVGGARLAGDRTSHSFVRRHGTLTDLYPLNSGLLQTVGPTGINLRGQIASGTIGSDGIYYPAIYDAHSGITLLGSLGAATSYGFSGVATSINNRGQAVGYSYIDGRTPRAFLYSDGVMTELGTLGGYSAALRINAAGQAVGFSSETYDGVAHAVLYSHGGMTVINPFDSARNVSYARGINDHGQVVGDTLYTAFLYSDGVSIDLGTLPGGFTSNAYSINNRGQIVGTANYPYQSVCWDWNQYKYVPCTKYGQHAFLYDNGVMKDLNSMIPADAGWDLQWAFDINKRGQIAGYGQVNGAFRAYLLTPVSEARRTSRSRLPPAIFFHGEPTSPAALGLAGSRSSHSNTSSPR